MNKRAPLSKRKIKTKLKERYGLRIIITEKWGCCAIICFNDRQRDILSKSWYSNKKHDECQELLQILKRAAAIFSEDITSTMLDNSFYPPPNQMFDKMNDGISHSMTYFSVKIILSYKRCNLERLKLTYTASRHAIILAVRSRSLLSRITTRRRYISTRPLDFSLTFYQSWVCVRHITKFRLMKHQTYTILSLIFYHQKIEISINLQFADNSDLNIFGIIKQFG